MVSLLDGKFLLPAMSAGSFTFDPAGPSPWSFANRAGIATAGSGFALKALDDGSPQYGFVQSVNGVAGSVSQAVDLGGGGSFILGGLACARDGGAPNGIEVLCDGVEVWDYLVPSYLWGGWETPLFFGPPGVHVVEVRAAAASGENTACLSGLALSGMGHVEAPHGSPPYRIGGGRTHGHHPHPRRHRHPRPPFGR